MPRPSRLLVRIYERQVTLVILQQCHVLKNLPKQNVRDLIDERDETIRLALDQERPERVDHGERERGGVGQDDELDFDHVWCPFLT